MIIVTVYSKMTIMFVGKRLREFMLIKIVKTATE